VDPGDGLTHYMTGPPVFFWCESAAQEQVAPIVVTVDLDPERVTCPVCRSAAGLPDPECERQQSLF